MANPLAGMDASKAAGWLVVGALVVLILLRRVFPVAVSIGS